MLARYLFRRNMFLLLLCLGVGTSVYLLADMFDRMDDFMEAGLSAGQIAWYFVAKTPLILSQILPAVFLMALVVQVGLMVRSREMLALQAGGMSFRRIVRFFIIYAIFWSVAQLAFSQFIGAWGEWEANRIWKEDVRNKQLDELVMNNMWFREGNFIVQAGEIAPGKNTASDVTIYQFDLDSQRMVQVFNADRARIEEFGWRLLFPQVLDTRTFQYQTTRAMLLPILQDIDALAAIEHADDRAQLPLVRLGQVIEELEDSGANVEGLRTAWHAKFSYAFTILVLTLAGLALTTLSENVYANVGLCLVVIFTQYGTYVLGVSAGQQGALSPVVAAWSGNVAFGGLAAGRLFYATSTTFQRVIHWLGQFFQGPIPVNR
ncbi:MAG: LptF/LptG family permease [Proteobacteria bacterium]|nr:LptF/LptG family permease [Pseudomonadota bacterium]MBU1612486.1 LptF/LptG family permease [Pseudomonadota bacterium]